jgi:outer membrane protein assembly factor BamB
MKTYPHNKNFILTLLIAFALALSGCSDTWFGEKEPPPLPGKRIDILKTFSPSEIPNSSQKISLPKPSLNNVWHLEGGNAQHNIGHPSFLHKLQILWSKKIGRAGSKRRPFHVQPVAFKNTLFVMDTRYRITAINKNSGNQKWSRKLSVPPHDLDAFGGGMSLFTLKGHAEPILFICTGYGSLQALETSQGQILWEQPLLQACHAPPVSNGDHLFVALVDNTLRSYKAENGQFLWRFTGTPQVTRLMGTATPAVTNSHVFYPLSTGELVAFDAQGGQTLWGDFLVRKQASSLLKELDDLRAHPVFDNKHIYAVSSSGTTLALNASSGKRIWKAEIPSVKTPWIAGNALFVLSNNLLVALNKNDGSLFWQTPLKTSQNLHESWLTPLLAGGVFYILNTEGTLLRINANDGSLLPSISLDGMFDTSPLVLQNTLFFLSRQGVMTAMQ